MNKNEKYLVREGIGYAAMFSFGDSYLAPFALFLGAPKEFIGIFSTLPSLVGSFLQIFSPKILKFFKNIKKITLIGVFLTALFWILFAFFGFFSNNLDLLLFFVILYTSINWIINPIWASWVGEVVNKKRFGAFFGFRSSKQNLTFIIATLTAGVVMNYFNDLIGFLIIFLIAALFRLYSFLNLSKVSNKKIPNHLDTKLPHETFFNANKKMKYFYLFVALFLFVTYIASPFFVVYQLKILNLNYFFFSILLLTPPLIKYKFGKYWGSAIDRYGPKVVLFTGALLGSLVPIIYYFSPHFFFLVFASIISGFGWGAWELALISYVLKHSKQNNRAEHMATLNFISGIFNFLGALLGSLIIILLPFMQVFLISGILRFLVAIAFLLFIYEHEHNLKNKINTIFLLLGFHSISHALINFRHYSISLVHEIKRKK